MFIETRHFGRNSPFINRNFLNKFEKIKNKQIVVFANVSKQLFFSNLFKKFLLIKEEFLLKRRVSINVQDCFIRISIFLL